MASAQSIESLNLNLGHSLGSASVASSTAAKPQASSDLNHRLQELKRDVTEKGLLDEIQVGQSKADLNIMAII